MPCRTGWSGGASSRAGGTSTASITNKTIATAKLPGGLADLFPIVRQYVLQRCFGKVVDLEDTKIRDYLRAVLVQEGIANYLARKIAELTAEKRAIGFYYPDWVAVQKARNGAVNWIIETKDRIWDSTAAKDAAIADWRKKVSAQTETPWRYKRIDQFVFGAGNFPTFTDLLTAADQRTQAAST